MVFEVRIIMFFAASPLRDLVPFHQAKRLLGHSLLTLFSPNCGRTSVQTDEKRWPLASADEEAQS